MYTRLAAIIPSRPLDARDTPVQMPLAGVVDESVSNGQLDGPVRLRLEGLQSFQTIGEARTKRSTNAVDESDAEACRWAASSGLIALQNEAMAHGANAVIGITSPFQNARFTDGGKFHCRAAVLMASVGLRGTDATVAAR